MNKLMVLKIGFLPCLPRTCTGLNKFKNETALNLTFPEWKKVFISEFLLVGFSPIATYRQQIKDLPDEVLLC